MVLMAGERRRGSWVPVPGPTSRTVPDAWARMEGMRSEEQVIWGGGERGGGVCWGWDWGWSDWDWGSGRAAFVAVSFVLSMFLVLGMWCIMVELHVVC